jgi:spore coat polysaccharide biosynthesis protein SpsF
MSEKTVAIIQARMGSKRLPGKVLRDIAGQPMLARVVGRARQAASLDVVVVATTTETEDDPVASMCGRRGYPTYRGHPVDVLDRFYQAAHAFQAEVIVRLTGDCPLIDPGIIDRTVSAFREAGADFAANRLPPPWKRTYPIGLDTEVCTLDALERAWREASQPHHREHVMPYLYEVEGRFHTLLVDDRRDLGHLRWTVDTPTDLALVREIYAHFQGRDDFTWEEVLDLYRREPRLAQINAGVHPKDYRESEGLDSGGGDA